MFSTQSAACFSPQRAQTGWSGPAAALPMLISLCGQAIPNWRHDIISPSVVLFHISSKGAEGLEGERVQGPVN